MDYTPIFVLIVLSLVQWRLAQAQSVICESAGVCQATEEKCIPDSQLTCFPPNIAKKKSASYEVAVEESDEIPITTSCSFTSSNRSDIELKNITWEYISINPRYASLCVSWSLTERSGYYGGLEVTLHDSMVHVCVNDPVRTRVCINYLEYNYIHNYCTVSVVPFPLLPNDNKEKFKKSESLRRDIEGCADVKHNGTICNIKHYPKPENVTVASSVCDDGMKRLNISWDHPRLNLDVPLPDVYHVYLYYNETSTFSRYFTVRNASQVLLSNLSAAHYYSVQVKAYRKCAGLGSHNTDEFGCGDLTKKKTEDLISSCPSSTTSSSFAASSTLGAHHLNITPGINASSNLYLIPVISVLSAATASLVVVSFIIILFGAKFYKRFGGAVHGCVYPKRTVNKVFVFYSPCMTQTRLEYIQKHVICNLLNYFEVVTLSDINKGNVSMWLEDIVKSADSVLLVGNKELCSDWENKERSSVLNSLELLISAAASLNTIAKFGLILTEDSTKDVCIPENSYLKLMPVFVMGKEKCEMEKLYQFVTKSQAIEFTTDSKQTSVDLFPGVSLGEGPSQILPP